MQARDISIVIPARNEAGRIQDCIDSARVAGAGEIIVADGQSDDETRRNAEEAGATHVVTSLPGRGVQQNAAAMFATGDVILFLHADNRLHPSTLRQITALPEDFVWGEVRQQIDSPHKVFRAIEWGNAARVRFRRMAFGDQAIFVKSEVLRSCGGFPEIPLMEDVVLSSALRKLAKPHLIDGPVYVSSRRWTSRGAIRQTLLNWKIQIAFKLGVEPERLVEWYR